MQTGIDLTSSRLSAEAFVPGLRRYLTADIASRGN
jgi:hypothetical protein